MEATAVTVDTWQVTLPLEHPIGTPMGPFTQVLS